MEQIQTKALETYLENIEYLKIKNKKLFDRVMMLSDAIEKDQYKERYHLEYIPEDKEFDIYDTSLQTFVYNRQPAKFIKDAVKNTNLDKLNSMDLLEQNIYNAQQSFPPENEKTIVRKTATQCSNDIFDYIKIFQKSTLYRKKQFKYIEKFIFIGSLLGTHIPHIVEKLKLRFYLIYEYNLEIFRLSLFTTNYAQLGKNSTILFSVMEEKELTEAYISTFFNHAIRSNYIVKYYCTNYNIHDFFDRILSVSAHKSPFTFSYWKIIEGLLKPSFKNIAKYPILNTISNHTLLKDKPVLIITAGPSFGKNIEWIKKSKDNYFIIAVAAVVPKLLKEGIEPNIITSVDGDVDVLWQFPEEIIDKISHIPFLTSSLTYHKVLDIFNKENIIVYEVMGAFKKTSAVLLGYTIGEITLNLASTLGASEIYLLGADLALDQDTGATHISEHNEVKVHDLTEEKKELNSFAKSKNYDMANSTVVVKGNFRETVVTTVYWEKAILPYNQIIKALVTKNPNLKIYNLNDGVYFENTIPTKIEELKIPIIGNTLSRESILKYLNQNSQKGFNNEELSFLKESVSQIDILIEKLIKLQKIKVKSYDTFISSRGEILDIILKDLKKYNVFYLDKLFMTYFLTIEPYLGYQFNEKLKNEANYIKKVKNIWCNQMLTLSYTYKELVEKI